MILECQCHGELVTVDRFDWPEPEPSEYIIEWYTNNPLTPPLWYRLKRAWRMIRGLEVHEQSLVLSVDDAARLSAVLSKAME